MALSSVLLGVLLFQGPGDGWANVPDARQVKRLYWDLFKTTEIWVRLIPETPGGKPPLVNLIFQAFYPGVPARDPYTGQPREPKGPPDLDQWREEHADLHPSDAVRAAVSVHFEERVLEWRPYLYRWLDGQESEKREQALIDAGAIKALGYQAVYVGAVSPRS